MTSSAKHAVVQTAGIGSDDGILSAAAIADPYTVLGRRRDQAAVQWDDELASWLILRHHEAFQAFKDPRISSDRIQPVWDDKLTGQQRDEREPTFKVLLDWMVFKDPPDHTRIRGLVKGAFTPARIGRLTARVTEIVDETVDAVGPGPVDIVSDVAYPIPAMVIAEILGVPTQERDLFKKWSNNLSVLVFGGAQTDDQRASAQRGLVGLTEYLHDLAQRYRKQPGDNLMSALLHSEDGEASLTEDEVVHTCALLLFGGHETTTNLIANGFLALQRHPDQRDMLLAELELVGPAIEELLRYDGPTKMVARYARETFEFNGCAFEEGQRILIVTCTANRDPRAFPDPDRLVIDRDQDRHAGFGFGIHYCLGAPLARLEAQLALPRLLERFRGVELPETEPEWLPLLLTRGMKALSVTL